MLALVGNHEYRFSRVAAHMIYTVNAFQHNIDGARFRAPKRQRLENISHSGVVQATGYPELSVIITVLHLLAFEAPVNYTEDSYGNGPCFTLVKI